EARGIMGCHLIHANAATLTDAGQKRSHQAEKAAELAKLDGSAMHDTGRPAQPDHTRQEPAPAQSRWEADKL
ncbi:hypothetical protein BRM70_24615, partial [Xanthomonas oryzae pv. oryzae]